jgi:hypothetical protein
MLVILFSSPIGSLSCVRANGYWRFILSYGRANGNRLSIFHFPPVSYISRIFCKPIAFTLVSYLAYSSALKMEACSSETSVDFQLTTPRYIPDDRTLHNHCSENLKSHNFIGLYSMLNQATDRHKLLAREGSLFLWNQRKGGHEMKPRSATEFYFLTMRCE